MEFIGVVDKHNEIVTCGSFSKEQMQKAYPDCLVVSLTNTFIPSDYSIDCYRLVLKDGAYTLVAKKAEEISAIEVAKAKKRRKASRQPSKENLKALLALDASSESEPLKTMIEFLQDVYEGAAS